MPAPGDDSMNDDAVASPGATPPVVPPPAPAGERVRDAKPARASHRALARRDRADRRDLALFAAVAVLALVLFSVVPQLPVGGLLMTFVTVFVSAAIGVVPHELAHAAVAKLFGRGVAAVDIGHGRPLTRFDLLGADITLRMVPLSGRVRLQPVDVRASNLVGEFLIYAAGPLAGFAIGALLVIVLLPGGAPLAPRYDWRLLVAVLSFGMFLDAAINLVPAAFDRVGRREVNDGRYILGLLLGDRMDAGPPRALHVPWLSRLSVPVLDALAVCFRTCAILACATLFTQLAWCAAGARVWYPWLPLCTGILVLWSLSSLLVLTVDEASWRSDRDRTDPRADPVERFVREIVFSERRDAEILALRAGPRIQELLRAQRIEDAEQELDRLAAAAPGSVYLAMLRIELLVTSGREAEAEQLVTSVRQAHPSSLAAVNAHAAFFRALLRFPGASGRAAAAIRAWVAVANDPERICVLLDLIGSGAIRDRLEGQFADVVTCTAMGVAIAPDQMPLAATHGALLVELGDLAAARPLLERVVAEAATEPDVGLALWYLALCAARTGDARSARRLARRARRLLPDPQVRERVQRELDAI